MRDYNTLPLALLAVFTVVLVTVITVIDPSPIVTALASLGIQ
jgi:hypothetical protein